MILRQAPTGLQAQQEPLDRKSMTQCYVGKLLHRKQRTQINRRNVPSVEKSALGVAKTQQTGQVDPGAESAR